MLQKPRCPVIAIEEHYIDEELASHFTGIEAGRAGKVLERMTDIGGVRLKEMDEAGIDVQILSHTAPAAQKIAADVAVPLCARVNDRLAELVAAHPDRFAAFATLPTDDAKAAADELERTVTKLGFKGAMLHGVAHGHFLDDKRFWPIYERAQALDVPIYFHPAVPDARVREAYFEDYAKDFPSIVRAAWGYTIETANLGVRLVLSGVFEAYPNFKAILGHFGETLPFLVWRLDSALSRPGQKSIHFRDVFCGHFYVTTSGFFSDPALLCCMMEMGVDRILFAVDWPFEANLPATRWIEGAPISDEDKAKILSGNVKRLLKM